MAALRDSIASNYDGVVLRKADKRDNLHRRGWIAHHRLEYPDLRFPHLQGLRQGRSFRLGLDRGQGQR